MPMELIVTLVSAVIAILATYFGTKYSAFKEIAKELGEAILKTWEVLDHWEEMNEGERKIALEEVGKEWMDVINAAKNTFLKRVITKAVALKIEKSAKKLVEPR